MKSIEATEYNRTYKPRDLKTDETLFDPSQRIKVVRFNQPSTPSEIAAQLEEVVEKGRIIYPHPLIQIRAIVPKEQHAELVQTMSSFSPDPSIQTQVNGVIPFSHEDKAYGLYWIQAASTKRKQFPTTRHEDAIAKGIQGRLKIDHPMPKGFSIKTINITGDTVNEATQTGSSELQLAPEQLADSLIQIHKKAFATPHDPTQQNPEGMLKILKENPSFIAFSPEGDIASVGLWQRDPRFTFGSIDLVEPTFFTNPKYEGLGLSVHLRKRSRALVKAQKLPHPTIVFQESIRHNSFPLAIRSGFDVGADLPAISGNLGGAYTVIGDASGENVGMMAMGLTYAVDPRITITQ